MKRAAVTQTMVVLFLFGCSGSSSPRPPAPGGQGGDETGGQGGSAAGGRAGTGGGGRGGQAGSAGGGGSAGSGGNAGSGAGGAAVDAATAAGDGGASSDLAAPSPDAGAPDQASSFSGNPFVYVGTGFSGTQIRIFQLDMQTGALTPRGTATSANAPTYMAYHPTRKFAYALSEASPGRIVAFSVDGSTGALGRLNDVASGGNGPCHLSMHGSGKWLFVAHYTSGHVSVIPVGADGRVAAAADVQKPVGSTAHGIIEDPSGQYVFMTTTQNDAIYQYRFDQATGKLTANTPASVSGMGQNPRHANFHPGGKTLYVVGESGGSVLSYDFDPATGRLSGGMATKVGASGTHIQAHPNGKFVFASMRGTGQMHSFSADAAGRLKGVSQVGGLGAPWDFALEPTGKYLLVAHEGGIRVYAINADTGALTVAGGGVSGGGPHYVGVMYGP